MLDYGIFYEFIPMDTFGTPDQKAIVEISELLSEIKIRDNETVDAVEESSVVAVNGPIRTVFPYTPAKVAGVGDKYASTPSQSTSSSEAINFSTPISNQNLCCNDATCSVCIESQLKLPDIAGD